MINDKANVKDFDLLKDADLGSMSFDESFSTARFVFRSWQNKKFIILEFDEITFFKITKDYKDNASFYVGEVNLTTHSDESFLKDMGYGYTFHKEPDKKQIYHFHMEGEIVVDIVCLYYIQYIEELDLDSRPPQ